MINLFKEVKPRQKAIFLFIALVLAFLFLLYLPSSYFDDGQSVCVSVMFFDTECYGCGMTRGIQHLIHLDFEQAWNYNKLAFIVLPLTIGLILTELYKLWKTDN